MRTFRVVLSLVGLIAVFCLAGCATDQPGDMPWNVQQSWEGSVGVPGFNNDR